MKSNHSLVDDDRVQRALDCLVDGVNELKEAKYNATRSHLMTKHILALEMQRHNKLPVSAQKREAEASAAYEAALLAEAEAAGEWERVSALRETAKLTIELYRTESANYRSLRIGD